MYYFSVIDTYSGVYQSQVIDVVKMLNEINNNEIKLIAFIPLNDFFNNRKSIKKKYHKSTVIPMFFGVTRWKKMAFLLNIFDQNETIICRGPLSAKLALNRFENVIYDGRAAVRAEVEEYDVVCGNLNLGADFINAEKEAVLKSNFRIAVSNKLVEYWKKECDYSLKEHVIIPCTLSSEHNMTKLTLIDDFVKIVYSGGIGPWQSVDNLILFLKKMLRNQQNIKVIFLTKSDSRIQELVNEFPNRCEIKWVSHAEVYQELSACDYGILLRDNNITNQVASPVKFAEYLNAGLKVLISENVGDFSNFVLTHKCGNIITKNHLKLNKVNEREKQKSKELCEKYFLKDSEIIKESFKELLKHC